MSARLKISSAYKLIDSKCFAPQVTRFMVLELLLRDEIDRQEL